MATPGFVSRFSSSVEINVTESSYKLRYPGSQGQGSLAGNCLILKVGAQAVGAVTVTDNKGNTWAQAVQSSGGNNQLTVMVSTNVAAGANVLTITLNQSLTFVQFDLSEWFNISQAAVATALDGTSSAVLVSGSPVAAGSITTGTSGDLVLQWGENNGAVDNAVTTFTKGSGFTKLASQVAGGKEAHGAQTTLVQYQVQANAGAINPTYTYSGGSANTSDTVAIAIKSATAGTAPAAFSLAGIQHSNSIFGNTTFPFELPHVGNLIHISVESEKGVSGITDGDSNTYQSNASTDLVTLPGTAYLSRSLRAVNTTANSDLISGVITFVTAGTASDGFVKIYDVRGADITQGTDGKVQTTTNTGTHTTNTNIDTVSITPQNTGAIILTNFPIERHTILDLVAPTAANGGTAALIVGAGFDGGFPTISQDNGAAVWFNGNSLSAQTFTYSPQGAGNAPTGVGNWGAIATEYKASAGVAPTSYMLTSDEYF